MARTYVFRTYTVNGSPAPVAERVAEMLHSAGFRDSDRSNDVVTYRYPSVTFSSKLPLTCISRLSVAVSESRGGIDVTVGLNFMKIKIFVTAVMLLMCVALPAAMGYIQHGMPEIPTVALIGIPLGFMVHYHVRWRVFRAVERLIYLAGEKTT